MTMPPPLALTDPRRDTTAWTLGLYDALGRKRGSAVFIAKQLGVSTSRICKILRAAGFNPTGPFRGFRVRVIRDQGAT